MRRQTQRSLCALLAVATLACGGAKTHQALWEPSASDLAVQAPDSFTATFETSAGDFVVEFFRDWATLGVDRVYHLTRYNFYAGARFFRVNPGLVQFGLSGQPALDSVWAELTIPDDPLVASNTRGTVSFAKSGPGSRNTQLFITRQDNALYDTCCSGGFPPIGRVVSGMEVVDSFNAAHGETPVMFQDSIMMVGNNFLDRRYPGLDTIARTLTAGPRE